MAENWSDAVRDVIKGSLESGDEQKYAFEGRSDKKAGYMVLSKKKVLFIEEHGFLHKTATLVFNDAYKDISRVECNKNQLRLVNTNGKTYIVESDIAETIKEKLESLMTK